MTAKSIIDVEINDAEFLKFQALFTKYQSQLKDQPSAWDKVNKAVKKANTPFGKIGAIMAGTATQIKAATTYQQKFNIAAQGGAKSLGVVAKSSAAVAKNIAKATISLLKFASISGIISGLIGGGSLFGLDRLALSASNSRRQSQGLGLKPGDLRSAQVNFGKFVDVDSTLESVANTRSDMNKRWIYSSMGVDPEKGSNVDVMAASMKAAKHIFEQNGMTQQGAEGRGLTDLFSMDDLRRLHEMTDKEIDDQIAKQRADRVSLAISDESQKSWQDLKIQLDRATATIENVLTNKLGSLTGPLSNLSDSVTKAFQTFVDSPKIAEWINDLGDSIQRFAKYLTSDEFRMDMIKFTYAITNAGAALYGLAQWIAKWFPSASPQSSSSSAVGSATGKNKNLGQALSDLGIHQKERNYSDFDKTMMGLGFTVRHPHGTLKSAALESSGNNNPGNLRSWGGAESANGFAKFKTPDDGLKAMASQLQIYQNRDHLKNISQVIAKWAPSSENDTAAYVSDVSKRTGFAADADLDLNDKQVLAKLMSAMTKHENSKSNYSQDSILSVIANKSDSPANRSASPTVIEIRNNTGGSAIVTTNALAY